MRRPILTGIFLLAMMACRHRPTEQPEPVVPQTYTSFGDSAIAYAHPTAIDLDKDGALDFTVMIPLVMENGRSEMRFVVVPALGNSTLLNGNLPVSYAAGERAPLTDQSPLVWATHQSPVLVAKIHDPATQLAHWEGVWKQQYKRSLAVRIKKNDNIYFGWIRFSYAGGDQEAIILHDAAIATKPGLMPKAL
ncbi:hypothetical protein [Chitinophaga eiseniae]|uniref:Lipoprotein n=1 Tax=Chitinophaga eiseniae TaxID=634771 RepID=A0A847SRI2_9BACT|nr:hypothetical protein [Chitinophaga eiseniae]NLR80568.1 hypothetical protein [Chitinophaga eiseniae]